MTPCTEPRSCATAIACAARRMAPAAVPAVRILLIVRRFMGFSLGSPVDLRSILWGRAGGRLAHADVAGERHQLPREAHAPLRQQGFDCLTSLGQRLCSLTCPFNKQLSD